MKKKYKSAINKLSTVILCASAAYLLVITLNCVPLLLILCALFVYQAFGSKELIYYVVPFIKVWVIIEMFFFLSLFVFLLTKYKVKLRGKKK